MNEKQEETVRSDAFHVVGVGASAGGLEALSQFLAGVPPNLHCVYVIAQHTSPNHRSMLVDILSRETQLPVREAMDGVKPELDVIYIIPPAMNLVFKAGCFHLTATLPEVSPRPSINLLFHSMAEEFDERAIGIVLSGTGSDGTRGLRAIKTVGGVTFVQEPETAKYDGMPRSAIESCVADSILAPAQMGHALERLITFSGNLPEPDGLGQSPEELSTLFDRVRERTKINFASYKLATVQRRLQRRMIATESHTLSAYLAYTETHPQELDALARETLISVTEFFRDKDAFAALERHVRDLVVHKKPGDEFRVWVAGCATGEEAYSIAIVLLEQIAAHGPQVHLQVFATDIDNEALTIARRGIYNKAAVADMPLEYVSRYFQPSGNGFEPVKQLRDCVTFARQDMTVDPPFLRMDLVACRNVLIYFNQELQAKVLSTLRYALRDDGLLFLGRSETVHQQERLFTVLDRRARLWRSREQDRPLPVNRLSRATLKPPAARDASSPAKAHERLFLDAVADRFGPAILIDAGLRILHSHGDVNRFISFPSGVPELNLTNLIVPEFSSEVVTTLHRARRRHAQVHSRKRRIATLDNALWRLAIHPLNTDPENETFLVVFEAVADTVSSAADEVEDTQGEHLEGGTEDELAMTREHLQALMEEMSASNEEMQALNEEVQAANEELQAINEELEASNEELQATNEELLSVNEESQIKSAQLAAVNSEFQSVYNTLTFPVVVFDTDLYLLRANSTAMRTYELPVTGGGQHIGHLKLPPHLSGIQQHLTDALASGTKRDFPATDGNQHYHVYVTPVVSATGNTLGVVLVVVDNTNLVSVQLQVRQSQERLMAIMNNSLSVVVLKDVAGRYEFVNRRFERLFGLAADAVLGKTDQQLFNPDLAQYLRGKDLDTMRALAAVESLDPIPLADSTVWLESVRFPVYDHNGVVLAVCTQAVDVTSKRHLDEQLQLAAKVFEHSGEAIAITDSGGKIISVNASFSKITGYSAAEAEGQTFRLLKSGLNSEEFYAAMWNRLAAEGTWEGEITNKRKNGEIYPEWMTINAVRAPGGAVQNYVVLFRDVTAIKNSQKQVEYLATHDELTGLPNRNLLTDRLKHAISRAKRSNSQVAVMFVDLDNFKTVNDTLGHDVGDELLQQAAERLASCVRDSDTLARLGGDEFVAVLSDLSIKDMTDIASRVVEYLGASFPIRGNNLFVSASVGISVFPDDGRDSVTLLKNADTAMYRAKDRGRNQYQFFADEMKTVALQRLTYEAGLRAALQNDVLSMVYQPKLDLQTGALIGVEALLRWRDPVLGEVPPAQLIPVAEGCGLMVALGDHVFQMVLRQIKHWRDAGLALPPVSINVSAHQLRDAAWANKVQTWLRQAGVAPDQVVLELTESALMNCTDGVRTVLQELQALGVRLSIDDFGTGYSSLLHLRRLPVSELKIDQRFVAGLVDQADDRAIAKTVIGMAHALGLQVVAEGVETQAQLAVLRADGCDRVQGFLFHPPLSAEALAALLPAASDVA